MSQWIALVGVLLAVMTSLIALVRSYSEDRGGSREWRRSVDDELKRLREHSANNDIHWTSRERDSLARQLEQITKQYDRIEELLKESLAERAKWGRDQEH